MKENLNNEIINNFKNKIDYRFKLLYAIAMMSVIADHCRGLGSIELNIQGWFHYSSFHMPLFMFAAGYFFKDKNINNTKKYIFEKMKKFIIPIYIYNIFYGFYIQIKKIFKFKYNKNFSFYIIFLEPLTGDGFVYIKPSWFSIDLFYVEIYNILKRKFLLIFKTEFNEFFFFFIDFLISLSAINYSNKGYNKKIICMVIFRFMHLNIYYQLGILYKKFLEKYFKKIKNDIYFAIIFLLKLNIHLYYGREIIFHYGRSNYFNYHPLIVIIISFLGIAFWLRISEIFEPILGKNYYINLIADNTYSIMMNHFLALDIIRTIFFLLFKYTKYCKDFNIKRYYLMDYTYIYVPKKIKQVGILYFLNCLFFPVLLKKIIYIIKYKFINLFYNKTIKKINKK